MRHDSYFSPASIRARYYNHINQDTSDDEGPIFDMVRDVVGRMAKNGMDEEQIRSFLKEKFHLSDEAITSLLEQASDGKPDSPAQ